MGEGEGPELFLSSRKFSRKYRIETLDEALDVLRPALRPEMDFAPGKGRTYSRRTTNDRRLLLDRCGRTVRRCQIGTLLPARPTV